MARRIAIGDVFELPTPCGYAYLQYTHEHPLLGSLVRVLDGHFATQQSDVSALIGRPHRFSVFYLVGSAMRDGVVRRVGNYQPPSSVQPFPATRRRMLLDSGWEILRNGNEVVERVSQLSEQQKLDPEAENWSDRTLKQRVASEWSWRDDAEEREEVRPLEPCYDIGVPWPTWENDEPAVGTVEHYSYFPTREAAMAAKYQLQSVADNVAVQPAADHSGLWLVKVVDKTGKGDELEDALIAVCEELAGEYDGMERRIE